MSMKEAVALALRGRGQASPNPLVGAILELDGAIVGQGFHTFAGVDHAEIHALKEAGDLARGATLYVTLEPCSHHGRTGPCAEALIAAGVAKVIAAAEDPNPLVAGRGFHKLRDAGVEVVLEPSAEADKLNEAFFHFMRHGRPLVTLKTALTLDGKIAAPDDNRGWITSSTAREHVQQVRHDSDAILTGIGTVLADDCFLTDRSGLPRGRPLMRVVLDSRLRLPLASRMVTSAEDDLTVVATSAAPADRKRNLEERGVRVLTFDGANGRADIRRTVEWLGEQRYLSLLVEAGSKVNWAVLEAEAVDKIFFYYAPKILGGTESLPMAGGLGRRRRADAIKIERVTLHPIASNEFAVEGYVHRDR